MVTYCWIEHAAANVGKDADIDSEPGTKGERDVDQFRDILYRIQVLTVRVGIFVGRGHNGDLGPCKCDKEKHEGPDELSNEDWVFVSNTFHW